MKLVKESFGDTYYSKAMDCVKVLREEAIRVRMGGMVWVRVREGGEGEEGRMEVEAIRVRMGRWEGGWEVGRRVRGRVGEGERGWGG